MPKELDLEIKEIIGELSDVNSKNEQKVVAIASWNSRPYTVDIRKYNTMDDILTKGISLTSEEAAELLYTLLSYPEYVKYDREKVYQILKEKEESEVNVEQLVQDLENESDSDKSSEIEEDSFSENLEEVVYGNGRIRFKKHGLFSGFVYKR